MPLPAIGRMDSNVTAVWRLHAPSADRDRGRHLPGRGTGHIVVHHQDFADERETFFFFDAQGAEVGSLRTGTMPPEMPALIGQASGFMGADCLGAICSSDLDVVSPTGQLLSTQFFFSAGVPANDPTGGVIIASRTRNAAGGPTSTAVVESVDDKGNARWSHPLPDPIDGPFEVGLAVDRAGNVLASWNAAGNVKAQWIDHAGNAGSPFSWGGFPSWPRVGSGLFVHTLSGWQSLDAGSSTPVAAPAWLAGQSPSIALHMVHGGQGYAHRLRRLQHRQHRRRL